MTDSGISPLWIEVTEDGAAKSLVVERSINRHVRTWRSAERNLIRSLAIAAFVVRQIPRLQKKGIDRVSTFWPRGETLSVLVKAGQYAGGYRKCGFLLTTV
ncbi:hypothetical protein R1flu_025614 [Riccia fluitans]|uniref:Uncharacterized protein n=1 Tax=Riccia fluitans TaxID=41844 RepID=A0ABD1XY89_9MARC